MAKMNLFQTAKVALESDEAIGSEMSTADVIENEVENIEAQDDAVEIQKITSEIEELADKLDEGIDEGEKLDEAIIEGEEVLAENEGGDVPDEAVEVAQEALNDAILLLAGREAKKQFKPSLESVETNFQKLRLSLESAKDFASNVWEKIKELFAKFMTMIKKLIMRIGAMFDKGTKQAEALAKMFTSRTVQDSEKITDEFKDKLANAYPTLLKIKGLNGLNWDEADPAASVKEASSIVKTIINGGSLTTNSSANKLLQDAGVDVELADGDEKESLIIAITRRSGVWYAGNQGTTRFGKVEISGSDVRVDAISAANLVKVANNVKVKAKAYKSAVNSALSALSSTSKEIDKLRNLELKNSDDYAEKASARKKANIAAKVATQAIFNSVSSAGDDIAGKLSILGLLSGVYKKA